MEQYNASQHLLTLVSVTVEVVTSNNYSQFDDMSPPPTGFGGGGDLAMVAASLAFTGQRFKYGTNSKTRIWLYLCI
jgi:hypothetical protein